MHLEKVNQDKVYEKKEFEKSCLDNAINKIRWLQKYRLIDDLSQERPDFILENTNERVGIEHFHIDLLYLDKKKHTGLARYSYNSLMNLFEKYNVKAINNTFDFKDSQDAGAKIEGLLNELIDCQNAFDYKVFMREWNRIFTKHYSKRIDYKKESKLDKLGFLIEVRRYFKFPYLCHKNKSIIKVDIKSMPITREIAEYLNRHDDGVDFFIIVVKDLFGDSVKVELYDKDNNAKVKYDRFELEKIPGKFQINIKD